MLETLTNDEIAERLIRDDYRWASNTITVNISALNYGGQIFANEAMAMWSDATGLNFVTTNSFFADLTFEHGTQSNTAVAGWSYTTSPGDSTSYVTDATITISEDWIEDDWSFAEGADLYSFSFKTFIHEIGHTIGMLHPGDYDGAGRNLRKQCRICQ
ncbi:MAG: matrixin family metalloprotease [Pseudomonadota bacterium]